MSDKILGKDFNFYIYRDGVPVAICYATDCIIDTDTEKLETTGPNSGRNKTFIAGDNETSISVPALTVYTTEVNQDEIEEYQDNGTIFDFVCGLYADMGKMYKGKAFVQHLNCTHVNRGILKFEANFTVTGPLTKVKKPIVRDIYISDPYGVRLAGCPNPYPVGLLWYDNTLIGLANNADEVIIAYNEWAITQGGFVELTTHDDNCNFTLNEQWNSPIHPDWIPAIPGGGSALAGYGTGTVLTATDIANIISA
jgi:hypothetical protein